MAFDKDTQLFVGLANLLATADTPSQRNTDVPAMPREITRLGRTVPMAQSWPEVVY